jgi:glycosyltransferase involved in cell wall biosynthesis
MFDRAARVLVLGQVWENFVITELGVPRDKITILPNAVAAPPPPPARPAATFCHIVMLGRLGPPKGLPELLEALGSDVLRDLPWRITLAGDGDAEPYRRDAAARGIAAKVIFAGWLDAPGVAGLLAEADILVLPSRSENLPVAVIEAMSYGVAVVTTPVGATPEIVRDEESALLVPVRDPAALARALARLIADPVLRQRIGGAGHAAFAARLDIRQSAATLANLYRQLMEQPR